MLYGKPRDAFLEFLRNLTPQALFLTCFFFILKLLDKPLPEDKTLLIAACMGCFFVFLFAFIANCLKFLEAFLEGQNDELKIAFERIKRLEVSEWRKEIQKIAASWRHNKLALFQGFFAIGIVFVSLFPVTMVAVQSLQHKT
jgi:hypothetical protein